MTRTDTEGATMPDTPHAMLIDEGTDAIPTPDDGETAEAEGESSLVDAFGGTDAYREGVAVEMLREDG